GGGVDQVVLLFAASRPAAAIAPGGGEPALGELERERAGCGLDADGPRSSSEGDVAAGVDEAWSHFGEDRAGPVGGVALGDSAQVDADAALQLDRARLPVDTNVARAACGGERRRGASSRQLREGAVVARGDESVVDRRVEPAARSLARSERELDQLEQLAAYDHRPALVQPRELGVRIEAREQALEATQVGLSGRERADGDRARRRLEHELDLCPHCCEPAAEHHELRVVATGGRVTTRTDGAGASA